jgi:hypothetical protein
VDCWTYKTGTGAYIDGDRGFSHSCKDGGSIICGLCDRGISVDCGDAKKFYPRMVGCEEDGKGVLSAVSI